MVSSWRAWPVYEVTNDHWAIGHVLLPGHSLRLEITSSHSPRFDRHLNTAEDQAAGTRGPTAAQTMWHEQRYPSYVLLPVIPQERNFLETMSCIAYACVV